MKTFSIVVKVPVQAESERAANAARSVLFEQLRLVLCRGIIGDGYIVDPITDVQFTTRTSLEEQHSC